LFFYDPRRRGEERDEHHFADWWHWPGRYTPEDKHDALIMFEEEG
jgi:hypothetical protein